MSGCPARGTALSAYLDGELEPDSAVAELEQHLAGCSDCQSELDALAAVSDAVRRELEPRAALDLPRARTGGARPVGRPRARSVQAVWRAGAAAAVLVLAAFGAYTLGARRAGAAARDALTGDLLSAHLRALLPGRLADVASSDRHQVKPWFAGRLDFSPPVPDLAAAGFPLLGGRLDFVGGERAAVLVYGRRLHLVDVFVLPARAGQPPAPAPTRLGYNLVEWREGPLRLIAVSDLDRGELAALARLHAAAAGAAPAAPPVR